MLWVTLPALSCDRLTQKAETAKGVFEQHLTHPQLSEVLCTFPYIGLQVDVS